MGHGGATAWGQSSPWAYNYMALSTKDAAAVKAAAIQGLGDTDAGRLAGKRAVTAGGGVTKDSAKLAAPDSNVMDANLNASSAGAKLAAPEGSPQQTGANAFQQTTNPVAGGAPVAGATSPLEAAPTPLAAPSKYQEQYQAKSGSAIPTDTGVQRAAVSGSLSTYQDTSAVDGFMSDDPTVNTLMSGIAQLLNPAQQTTSLMQDYDKLHKKSGLDKINAELIDAETVINGTEDDIRNEIQTAGGFGTESQVQAMALARNKSLLKRYNQLVQMKTDAQNQLSTLMQLSSEDKQMAQNRVNNQIGAMFQMANFRQNAINNTKEQARWLVQTMGADGVYNAYAQDPRQLAFLEHTLGVAPGGMKGIAAQAAQERMMTQQDKQLGLDLKREQISTERMQRAKLKSDMEAPKKLDTQVVDMGNGIKALVNMQTGEHIKDLNPAEAQFTEQAAAHASQGIKDIDALKTHAGMAGTVGAYGLARWTPFKVDAADKQDFVASVEQLRSQLTLTSLIDAKSRGATFGALSEGEMRVLDATATKIGTWAIKDKEGNITGYKISEALLKKELDKISNYAKLDYVVKGGNAEEVGVRLMNDGHYYTQNSDGSYTILR